MRFRTGLVAGAAVYLGARAAAAAVRRVEPGRRLTRALTTRLDAQVDRAVRRLTAKAEHGGPVLKGALAGVRALAEGKSPARAALSAVWTVAKETLKGIFGGGRKIKVTNIVEQIDIGAPRRMVYDQWTQFEDFPSFMKKVISVNQESDEKLTWTAQIFWSTRSWESTITQQTPDEHIAWQSKGAKGHVDGSVTFHELAPDMTRVLVDLEYHPKGFFEKTANLWRAQGRRTRLELKHFRRHLTNHVLTHPEELHGWRGQIRDSEVVVSHEEAVGEKGGEKKEAAREEPRRERAEERAERREHEKV